MTSRQMLSKSLTWGNWLQMSLSYLPGTASLLEELDKKLMVLLRDGRTLIGEQLNTPNGLFQLLFKVEVSFLNKMWIWGRINPEYRKQTWQKCFLSGYLRSVDQFANLVLHQTIERIHVGKCYGDIPRGVFVVRGENVVLLGEIDAEKTEPKDIGLTEVSLEEILEKQVNWRAVQ